jgi:dihydroorotate dehydrogenase (fumarate)
VLSATRAGALRLVSLILVASALVGLSGLSAPGARADDTSGISGGPSDGVRSDDRSRFSYQVAPGQVIQDFYLVRNSGTTPSTMKVFGTDAFNAEDGAYGLLETGVPPTDAGSWVTFDGGVSELTIPLEPGASKVVPFTVTVPADARPGDHAAGIVISVSSIESQILVDRRVGTRLYVRVPGDLQPILTITNLSAAYEGQWNPLSGQATLTFTLENTGNVALSGNLLAGVNTYFGIGAGQLVRQGVDELLPGSERTISVAVPGIPQIGYLNPYVRLVPTVDEGAMDPGQISQVSRDTVLFAMPWWLLAIIVVVLIILVIVRIRRRRDERASAEYVAYVEAEARRAAAEDREPVGSGRPGEQT